MNEPPSLELVEATMELALSQKDNHSKCITHLQKFSEVLGHLLVSDKTLDDVQRQKFTRLQMLIDDLIVEYKHFCEEEKRLGLCLDKIGFKRP